MYWELSSLSLSLSLALFWSSLSVRIWLASDDIQDEVSLSRRATIL